MSQVNQVLSSLSPEMLAGLQALLASQGATAPAPAQEETGVVKGKGKGKAAPAPAANRVIEAAKASGVTQASVMEALAKMNFRIVFNVNGQERTIPLAVGHSSSGNVAAQLNGITVEGQTGVPGKIGLSLNCTVYKSVHLPA